MALNGKAGEAWERIFGGGETTGPLTGEMLLAAIERESGKRYHPESEMGAYRAVVEAEMRGLSARIDAEDRRLGDFVDAAYLPCDCGPDDCPCCCRCGCPAPEGAGSG